MRGRRRRNNNSIFMIPPPPKELRDKPVKYYLMEIRGNRRFQLAEYCDFETARKAMYAFGNTHRRKLLAIEEGRYSPETGERLSGYSPMVAAYSAKIIDDARRCGIDMEDSV